MRFFLATLVGLFLFPAAGVAMARDFPQIESCVAGVKTYTYELSDKNVDRRRLNAILSQNLHRNPELDSSWNEDEPIPASAEWVKIEIERIACSDAGQNIGGTPGQNIGHAPDMGASAIGGCTEAGCTGDLPAEFTGNPGDTISISRCGSGVQESGTFVMNEQGAWVMTKFSSEFTVSCGPDL